MRPFTFDELRAEAATAMLHERVLLSKSFNEPKDVFLSYSSTDLDRVKGVEQVLKKLGKSVYVDHFQNGSESAADLRKVAARLEVAVPTCRRFIVVATENTAASRWVPWELGMAAMSRGYINVATLPVAERPLELDWMLEGYFGIYPRIAVEGSAAWVLDPRTGTKTPLTQWLG